MLSHLEMLMRVLLSLAGNSECVCVQDCFVKSMWVGFPSRDCPQLSCDIHVPEEQHNPIARALDRSPSSGNVQLSGGNCFDIDPSLHH